MRYKNILVFFSVFLLFCIPLPSQTVPVEGAVSAAEDDFCEREFWAGLELFRSESYGEAAATLEPVVQCWAQTPPSRQPHPRLSTAATVYCLSLMRSGRQEAALKAFASFHGQGILDEAGTYNYALAAFRQRDFSTARQVASAAAERAADSVEKASGAHSFDFDYVAAASAFNLGKWREAEVFFKESLRQAESFSGKAQTPAKAFFRRYYLGLAQFRQGKLEEAYFTLAPLCLPDSAGPDGSSAAAAAGELQNDLQSDLQEAGRQALSISLHCAMQLYAQDKSPSWWERGCGLALQLVDCAETPAERQEAALLAANIYRDGGRYQRALELLEPYRHGQDEPSLSCRFLRSEILTSQGRLEEAMQEYGAIAEICSAVPQEKSSREVLALGDRAAYRQGELLYSLGNYTEASAVFAAYRRKYPAGNYLDAALYFNGEALEKAGLTNRAILQHETLLKDHPSSPYLFSSLARLMDLYKKTGEYGRGLEAGNQLMDRFFQQAQAAGIPGKLAELRLLEQGLELSQASLLAEYSRAGECRTAAGRRIGLELAHFYANSIGQETEGEALLLQILEHRGAGEETVAAQASYLLGDLYRNQDRYREAAGLFLQAAQLYLEIGGLHSEDAAAALYRGAESFDVAGMQADAQSVARQLSSLFPQSPWTTAAQIFL